MHSCPSACKGPINLLKHEPSAQSPWQKTMLGLVRVILLSLNGSSTFGSVSRKILLEAKYQAAERHVERAIDSVGFRRGVIGHNFNGDGGIAHWNYTGLRHALDSHIDLSLREATCCIDDSISLKAVGQSGDGWERETDIGGDTCDDEVLAAGRLDRIDDTFLVPGVDGGAFDALYAAQNFGELGDDRAPHFLGGRGYNDGNFEREHGSSETNDVVLELKDVDVTN